MLRLERKHINIDLSQCHTKQQHVGSVENGHGVCSSSLGFPKAVRNGV